MHAKLLPRRRNIEELEMKSLLKGSQACAVYFDDFNWRPESIDPVKINAVVRLIERTGKTPIVGARFQRTVITAEQVKKLRTVPKAERVRGELLAVLGGAAQALAGTLSTPASGLAFTLEGRQKAMEDEQGGAPASPEAS
jgi:ribosomal protein L10